MGSKLAPMMVEFVQHCIETKLKMPDFYNVHIHNYVKSLIVWLYFIQEMWRSGKFSQGVKFTMEQCKDKSIDYLGMTAVFPQNRLHTAHHQNFSLSWFLQNQHDTEFVQES